MLDSPAKRRERSLIEVTEVLRRVAGAVRGLRDFEHFLGGVSRLYQGVSILAGRRIAFDPVGEGKPMPLPVAESPAINAPVANGDAVAGFVRVFPSEEARQFGPEDLHLVGTLADLTGALVDVSQQLGSGGGLERMMREITDQLPLGLVCFLPSGELVIANAQSRVLLGGFVWKSLHEAWDFLQAHADSGPIPAGPGRFSMSLPSGTVHVEIKEVETVGNPTCTVITMAQFTANEQKLVQVLERESFRSRWLQQPLAFLAIRATGDPTGLFATIPDIRKSLGSVDQCEYLGKKEIGFVLPGKDRVQALRIARDVCRRVARGSVEVGCSLLEGQAENPDAMIEGTLERLEPVIELLEPRLLVVDRYSAIPETIQQVMRGRVAIEYAGDHTEGLKQLQDVPVDGVMVEHEPEAGLQGFDFVHEARILQPGLEAVLTTTLLNLESGRGGEDSQLEILRKPFTVSELRRVVEPLLPAPPAPSSDR